MITDKRKIWQRFYNIFKSVEHFYSYQPALCNYHKRLLEELCEDNIFYAELRSPLTPVSSVFSIQYTVHSTWTLNCGNYDFYLNSKLFTLFLMKATYIN